MFDSICKPVLHCPGGYGRNKPRKHRAGGTSHGWCGSAMDRFHLVMDAIDRLPQTGDRGIYLKQKLRDKLVEHKQYIARHGQDLPEVRNWNWGNPK